jgi:hypothetical protein
MNWVDELLAKPPVRFALKLLVLGEVLFGLADLAYRLGEAPRSPDEQTQVCPECGDRVVVFWEDSKVCVRVDMRSGRVVAGGPAWDRVDPVSNQPVVNCVLMEVIPDDVHLFIKTDLSFRAGPSASPVATAAGRSPGVFSSVNEDSSRSLACVRVAMGSHRVVAGGPARDRVDPVSNQPVVNCMPMEVIPDDAHLFIKTDLSFRGAPSASPVATAAGLIPGRVQFSKRGSIRSLACPCRRGFGPCRCGASRVGSGRPSIQPAGGVYTMVGRCCSYYRLDRDFLADTALRLRACARGVWPTSSCVDGAYLPTLEYCCKIERSDRKESTRGCHLYSTTLDLVVRRLPSQLSHMCKRCGAADGLPWVPHGSYS